MNINEVLRSQTNSARDRLRQLDEAIVRAEAERNAAAERVKRATSEITKHKTVEAEQKRSQSLASDKVAEAERVFEELERKRQEALDTLARLQEDLSNAGKARRKAQSAIEYAIAEVRREETYRQSAETKLVGARSDHQDAKKILRHALLQGLACHLEQQNDFIRSAFSTQEQKANAARAAEAFRKTRHNEPKIGKLCDERDELRKLLSSAMVPGVKAMLQESLNKIEQEIVKLFPGAFDMVGNESDNPIEELLFYCDKEAKAVFLLPITPKEWITLADTPANEGTKTSACIIWNMIQELGLRPEDGDFTMIKERTVFASQLDLETVASQNFSVKCDSTVIMRFVLTPVPSELQEALTDEDPND